MLSNEWRKLFFLFVKEKADIQPEPEKWEAKHFYDPLPMSTPSPPDNMIFKNTPYTFKLHNGNGMYSTGLPHAVINPAVLQRPPGYPPGHVFEQRKASSHQPPDDFLHQQEYFRFLNHEWRYWSRWWAWWQVSCTSKAGSFHFYEVISLICLFFKNFLTPKTLDNTKHEKTNYLLV